MIILIGQATISVIVNLVYKSCTSARLNSLLMPLVLGTKYILKALLILMLIGAVGL